jgi:aminopeptidase
MPSITFEQKLARYARILVEVGVNIQPGDALSLQADITDDPTTRQLVHQIVATAYDAGARIVDINWQDPQLGRIRLLHADENTLDEVAEWQTDKIATIAHAGVSSLTVVAPDPELLTGIDRDKIQRTTIATQKSMEPFLSQLHKNVWSVATIPVQAWADKVFPAAPAAERLTLLWEAIFQASRVYADDPIAAWRTYSKNQSTRCDVLTAKHYTALHFTGGGTDLTVGLSENHIYPLFRRVHPLHR